MTNWSMAKSVFFGRSFGWTTIRKSRPAGIASASAGTVSMSYVSRRSVMIVHGFGISRPCMRIICIRYGDISGPASSSEESTPTFFLSRRTAVEMSFEMSYSTKSCRSGSKKGITLTFPNAVCATSPKKNTSSSERAKRLTPACRASSSASVYWRGSSTSSLSLPPESLTYSSSRSRT